MKIICPKCGGKGRIPRFAHVDEGVCFECKGRKYIHFSGASSAPSTEMQIGSTVRFTPAALPSLRVNAVTREFFRTHHGTIVHVSRVGSGSNSWLRVKIKFKDGARSFYEEARSTDLEVML